jgi:hypothetical protein
MAIFLSWNAKATATLTMTARDLLFVWNEKVLKVYLVVPEQDTREKTTATSPWTTTTNY